jgi:hypothetical protein
MKVLAIGDIHTKTWIIDLVKSVIDNYDMVVFCGDYADDWNASAHDSVDTWQRLRTLSITYPNKVKAVRGNHDYIYTVQTPTLQSGYNPHTQRLLDTPVNKYLKEWLTSLPLVLTIDNVTYSHAGIDKRWNGEQTVDGMWNDVSPIWTRPQWADYKAVPQVVGHTPQKTVTEVQPGIWLIDTFSTYADKDRTPIGDGSMLEVTDGKEFKKVKYTL